jgi:hypothetical protein
MILDYDDRQGTAPVHYALLVGEDESEPIFERVVPGAWRTPTIRPPAAFVASDITISVLKVNATAFRGVFRSGDIVRATRGGLHLGNS